MITMQEFCARSVAANRKKYGEGYSREMSRRGKLGGWPKRRANLLKEKGEISTNGVN
jgi:hypothetical protein